MMLSEYLKKTSGYGVLATADSKGKVDAAIYARPYVVDETTVAFVMADRLTRKNLESNPSAAYLFLESDQAYRGKRLYLTRVKELKGSEIGDAFLKERYDKACKDYPGETLFLVYFRVERVLPVVGDKE